MLPSKSAENLDRLSCEKKRNLLNPQIHHLQVIIFLKVFMPPDKKKIAELTCAAIVK